MNYHYFHVSCNFLLHPIKQYDVYEQMLLYDETYRAGYGEYGMFLFRTGQKEAGQALWTEYKSKGTMLDDTVSRNLELWEKEMGKIEEKS